MPPTAINPYVFVSLYMRNREPLLRGAGRKRLMLSKMLEAKRQFQLRIAGYVVLDNHVQWLFSVPPENEASKVIDHVRAAVQQDWRGARPGDGLVWEPEVNITRVPGKEDLRNYLDYIHYAPLLHGVAPSPAEYKWSSLPARVAEGRYPEDWGCLGPPAAVARVARPVAEMA
jgi:putative transposase